MHPIERLRYVARASGAGQAELVRETAGALAAFADDPAGMVTACRRILGRQLPSGPLWWLCGRVLNATEPMREAWDAAEEVEADPTARELAHALPQDATVCVLGWPEQLGAGLPRRGDLEVLVVDVLGEGSGLVRMLSRRDVDAIDVPMAGIGGATAASDVLVLEASMIGPDSALCVTGSLAAAAVARHAEVPVWLVGGVGRLVPRRIFDHVTGRLDAGVDPWEAEDEIVPLDLVTRICGPTGPTTVADAILATDCPLAPELLREL